MPPEFPRYESKGQLTTQQASVMAPADTEGQRLDAVAKAGASAVDAGVKWSNALDTIQKTTATANFKSGMLDILQRAENDPNYNNSDQYLKEVEKLKTDNLKGFANKSVEREMALNFGYESKVGGIQIQSLYKKKMIDVGQVSTMRLLDIEAKNPSPDMQTRMGSILNQQVAAGLISHKDAYTLEQNYVKEGKYNAFLSDLNNNPETVGENLSKNAYGMDSKDLEKAKNSFTANQKRETELRQQQQLATVNSFGQKLAERTLTQEEVQDALVSGTIDADMALNFELAMAGPEKWSEFASEKEQGQKSKIITGLLDKLDSDDAEGRTKIINSSIQNYNDKKINADDLAFVLRVANGKSAEPQNPIWGFLKSAVKMTEPMKNSAQVMQKFKDRWDFKEDPREVMKQASIDQFKEERPETASFKIGDVVKRKSGSYEMIGYNEDGTPAFRKK